MRNTHYYFSVCTFFYQWFTFTESLK